MVGLDFVSIFSVVFILFNSFPYYMEMENVDYPEKSTLENEVKEIMNEEVNQFIEVRVVPELPEVSDNQVVPESTEINKVNEIQVVNDVDEIPLFPKVTEITPELINQLNQSGKKKGSSLFSYSQESTSPSFCSIQ